MSGLPREKAPASARPATLARLTEHVRRLALVGLAKNTGKTETLAALLREHATAGRPVGVTSIGRDGEAHDVIDSRIAKPRVRLQAGDLVASTGALLRAGGAAHERLLQTGIRTPLGEVLVARLLEPGIVEVAGPSAAADMRAVSDAMLSSGAGQILIDGAIDRRAASSPDVSDGLVMATGAVLGGEIGQVVAKTVDAVDLVRLPGLDSDDGEGQFVREQAKAQERGVSVMVDEHLVPHPLPPRFVLTAESPVIYDYLCSGSTPRWLLISGALPEAFLEGLIIFAQRRKTRLKVLASDPTRVFLSHHDAAFYATAGIELRALHPIALLALTVNPVAPQSHHFDSQELREAVAAAIDKVPVVDVLDPEYVALAA